jgi:E3 ubiquitin-protein ligase ZNF598
VLNAKLSTTVRSSQSSRQVLDRVAQAAASSSRLQKPPERFPPLQSAAAPISHTKPPAFRQVPRTTPWSSSGAATSSSPAPTSVPGRSDNSSGNKKTTSPPLLSKAAFPELPQSSVTRVPKGSANGNQSLRNIIGDSASPGSAWGTGGSSRPIQQTPSEIETGAPSGKGRKGKGKQKQTLFTLGSFPT